MVSAHETLAQLALLKRVQLFSSLSDAELAFLASHVVPRRYASGEIVFSEGDPCVGLYVVHSGNVRIFKSRLAAASRYFLSMGLEARLRSFQCSTVETILLRRKR
jgi:CRP-like cAMP-binding protein